MTPNDIEIQCPGCGLLFTVPIELAGDVGTCRSCGSDVPVRRRRRRKNDVGIFTRIVRGVKKWLAPSSQHSSA